MWRGDGGMRRGDHGIRGEGIAARGESLAQRGDDDNTEQESLGLLLSKCRRRKGLSQQQVANLLGYAHAKSISSFEKNTKPTPFQCQKLAKIYAMTHAERVEMWRRYPDPDMAAMVQRDALVHGDAMLNGASDGERPLLLGAPGRRAPETSIDAAALTELRSLLGKTSASRVVAVFGLPDAGKSTLLAELYATWTPPDGQSRARATIWLDFLRDPAAGMDATHAAICHALHTIDPTSLLRPISLSATMVELDRRRTLIILDHIDAVLDPETAALPTGLDELLLALSGCEGARTVVCSGTFPKSATTALVGQMRVDGLSEKAAVALIRDRLPTMADTHAVRVARLLGGHPAAVIALCQLVAQFDHIALPALLDDPAMLYGHLDATIRGIVPDATLERLTPGRMRLLHVLSILDRPLERDVCAHIRLPVAPSFDMLAQPLVERALLRATGDGYALHPTVRWAVARSRLDDGDADAAVAAAYGAALAARERSLHDPVRDGAIARWSIERARHLFARREYDAAMRAAVSSDVGILDYIDAGFAREAFELYPHIGRALAIHEHKHEGCFPVVAPLVGRAEQPHEAVSLNTILPVVRDFVVLADVLGEHEAAAHLGRFLSHVGDTVEAVNQRLYVAERLYRLGAFEASLRAVDPVVNASWNGPDDDDHLSVIGQLMRSKIIFRLGRHDEAIDQCADAIERARSMVSVPSVATESTNRQEQSRVAQVMPMHDLPYYGRQLRAAYYYLAGDINLATREWEDVERASWQDNRTLVLFALLSNLLVCLPPGTEKLSAATDRLNLAVQNQLGFGVSRHSMAARLRLLIRMRRYAEAIADAERWRVKLEPHLDAHRIRDVRRQYATACLLMALAYLYQGDQVQADWWHDYICRWLAAERMSFWGDVYRLEREWRSARSDIAQLDEPRDCGQLEDDDYCDMVFDLVFFVL